MQRLFSIAIVIVSTIVLAVPTLAAPIAGFSPFVQHTGFNLTSFQPIVGGLLDLSFLELLATTNLRGGRDMDWLQVVDNNTTIWSTRAANDNSPKGITYETDVRVAEQIRNRMGSYIPWINSPLMADEDHDRKMGQLWGAGFHGSELRFAKGNEVWNVFAGNLGHWNLLQARAEGFTGSDFDALSKRQGRRLAKATKSFIEGFRSTGNQARIIMEVEGFAPITHYAKLQLDQMIADGESPAALNAHVAIAQYSAGSQTDLVGLTPASTDAQMASEVKRFIDVLVGWTLSHRALASAYGLESIVDAYELRFGQSGASDPAMVDRWILFQNSAAERDVQNYGWRRIVEASGGVEAALNLEGVYGHPWGQHGQFSLLNIDQFASRNSGAYLGTLDVIDFSDVPEPEMTLLAWLASALLIRRPRHFRTQR